MKNKIKMVKVSSILSIMVASFTFIQCAPVTESKPVEVTKRGTLRIGSPEGKVGQLVDHILNEQRKKIQQPTKKPKDQILPLK
ncbi:unnamed protein product [Cunninghamella blakesleeana]